MLLIKEVRVSCPLVVKLTLVVIQDKPWMEWKLSSGYLIASVEVNSTRHS